MQILKSGSLTSKNRGIISLTPEDLRNHSFAVFSINCKCAVDLFVLKDAPIDTSFVPQVSYLNMCGVSKKPSVEKLWREKTNMQMNWSSLSAAFAQFRDQRNAAAT